MFSLFIKDLPWSDPIHQTVCAYHVLHSVRTRLKQTGLSYRWETIRERLRMHTRETTRLQTHEEKTIHIRKCSHPEPFQAMVYDALNLEHVPCKPKKVVIEQNL